MQNVTLFSISRYLSLNSSIVLILGKFLADRKGLATLKTALKLRSTCSDSIILVGFDY